jgi:hypothetical protein
MTRSAANYLAWVQAGNTSRHLDRVRVALDTTPRTRREIAERAGVSYNYASVALDVLVELGEAERRGVRPHGRPHPAKLYARATLDRREKDAA